MSTANTTTSEVTAPAPRFDFPTWLPPMLVKELRQGLRARGFVISLIALHAVLVFAFVWALIVDLLDSEAALSMVNGFFWTLTGLVLGLVTPLRALGGLRSEMDARNVDLLMLTRLTSWRIVLGKWTSLVTQSALLVLTLLPYGVVRYFFGTVDLLQDLGLLAWMFSVSCAATALMLWFSGLNRFMRVMTVVAAVFLLNAVFGSSLIGLFAFGLRGGRGLFSGGGSGMPVVIQICLIYDLAILLVFCLLQAVRRIAPPSENHSVMTRLLGLAALLPLPVLAIFRSVGRGWRDGLEMQTVLALIAFMLVCVLELAMLQVPMAVQVRTLFGKGGARAFFGRFLLPGWPSAALFTAAGLAIFAVLCVTGAFPDPMSRLNFLRVLGLVWVAVVLPAAVMSLVIKRGGTVSVVVYGAIQGAIGAVCLLGAFFINEASSIPNLKEGATSVFRALPVTGFWFELVKMDRRVDMGSPTLLAIQCAVVFVVFMFIGLRSRGYWNLVSHYADEAKKLPRAE